MKITLSPEVKQRLTLYQLSAPGMTGWILEKAAPIASDIGGRGALSGSVPGFGPDTGKTKLEGMFYAFKKTAKNFNLQLWHPLGNMFENFKKRRQVRIISAFANDLESSDFIEPIIQEAFKLYDEGFDFRPWERLLRKSGSKKNHRLIQKQKFINANRTRKNRSQWDGDFK